MSEISLFEILPDEILDMILSYGTVNNQVKLEQVCQRFRQIIQPKKWYVSHLDLYIHNSQLNIESVLERINPDRVSVHLQKLIGTKDLGKIYDNIYDHKKESINTKSKNCSISLFNFSRCSDITNEYLKLVRNNAKVDLSGCTKITTNGLLNCSFCQNINLTNCTQLEIVAYGWHDGNRNNGTINLTGCTNLRGESLAPLWKAQRIILDYCPQITDEHLKKLLSHHQYPQALSLRGTSITGEIFKDRKYRDKIRTVDTEYIESGDLQPGYLYVCVQDCAKLTDSSFEFLAKNSDVINIAGCKSITNDGLDHLRNCRKINLSNCPKITDGIRYLQKCQEINLSDCPKITTRNITKLVSCRKITLSSGNPNIDYERIRRMIPKVVVI